MLIISELGESINNDTKDDIQRNNVNNHKKRQWEHILFIFEIHWCGTIDSLLVPPKIIFFTTKRTLNLPSKLRI